MYFRWSVAMQTICCYFFFSLFVLISLPFGVIINDSWMKCFCEFDQPSELIRAFIYMNDLVAVIKMIEISSLMKTNPIEMWFKLMCFYCLHLIYVINESMIWFKRITNIENLVIKMNGIIDIGLSKPFICGMV